jgi:hypothetical protein
MATLTTTPGSKVSARLPFGSLGCPGHRTFDAAHLYVTEAKRNAPWVGLSAAITSCQRHRSR